MKNNRGITLIALVITIIVLLILAGVSIAMLTGNNGILSQATNSVDATDRAEVVERINMELQAAYGEALTGNSSMTFNTTTMNTNLDGKATANQTGSTLTITATEDANITGNVVANGSSSTMDPAE